MPNEFSPGTSAAVKTRSDAGMAREEGAEIADREPGVGMRRADRLQPVGTGGRAVIAVAGLARHLGQAVETRPRWHPRWHAHGASHVARGGVNHVAAAARGRVEDGIDDLEVSRAAAQHAAQRIHDRLPVRMPAGAAAARRQPSACPACRCRTGPRRVLWNAACRARPTGSSAIPSMVAMDRPCTCAADTMQAHAWAPSMSTVQAPQSPALHPTLVPVSPRPRRTRSDRRSPGAHARRTAAPFRVNASGACAIVTVSFMRQPRDRPRHTARAPGARARWPHRGDSGRSRARRRWAPARKPRERP